jgi:hypothetical protein
MKKFLFCISCILGFLSTTVAQGQQKDSILRMLPEEDGPLVLKFEPNMDVTANRKRALFKMERRYIDTMQISEKKKQRLLRNLYKEIHVGTFEKTFITNTGFEDDIDP